jgi:hypothetical protein
VLKQYLEDSQNSDLCWTNAKPSQNDVYFTTVAIELRGRQPKLELVVNSTLQSNRKFKEAFIAIDILDSFGGYIGQAVPSANPFVPYTGEEITVETVVDLPPLIPGRYRVSCWIGSHFSETMDWVKDIVSFEITESPTPGRNYQHSFDRGFCVPTSRARVL